MWHTPYPCFARKQEKKEKVKEGCGGRYVYIADIAMVAPVLKLRRELLHNLRPTGNHPFGKRAPLEIHATQRYDLMIVKRLDTLQKRGFQAVLTIVSLLSLSANHRRIDPQIVWFCSEIYFLVPWQLAEAERIWRGSRRGEVIQLKMRTLHCNCFACFVFCAYTPERSCCTIVAGCFSSKTWVMG